MKTIRENTYDLLLTALVGKGFMAREEDNANRRRYSGSSSSSRDGLGQARAESLRTRSFLSRGAV